MHPKSRLLSKADAWYNTPQDFHLLTTSSSVSHFAKSEMKPSPRAFRSLRSGGSGSSPSPPEGILDAGIDAPAPATAGSDCVMPDDDADDVVPAFCFWSCCWDVSPPPPCCLHLLPEKLSIASLLACCTLQRAPKTLVVYTSAEHVVQACKRTPMRLYISPALGGAYRRMNEH